MPINALDDDPCTHNHAVTAMMDEINASRMLELRFRADGMQGLLPLLNAAVDAVLDGRYRIVRPIAARRQSFVFLAADLQSGNYVAIKQPAFDYRHPLKYSRQEAARGRDALEREHEVLRACQTGHLPRLLGFLSAAPIVPAAAECTALSAGEVYLIEEWIDGDSLRSLVLCLF